MPQHHDSGNTELDRRVAPPPFRSLLVPDTPSVEPPEAQLRAARRRGTSTKRSHRPSGGLQLQGDVHRARIPAPPLRARPLRPRGSLARCTRRVLNELATVLSLGLANLPLRTRPSKRRGGQTSICSTRFTFDVSSFTSRDPDAQAAGFLAWKCLEPMVPRSSASVAMSQTLLKSFACGSTPGCRTQHLD